MTAAMVMIGYYRRDTTSATMGSGLFYTCYFSNNLYVKLKNPDVFLYVRMLDLYQVLYARGSGEAGEVLQHLP
jgi:hypothetical protein